MVHGLQPLEEVIHMSTNPQKNHWQYFFQWGSPSHHGFQYQVMVHDDWMIWGTSMTKWKPSFQWILGTGAARTDCSLVDVASMRYVICTHFVLSIAASVFQCILIMPRCWLHETGWNYNHAVII